MMNCATRLVAVLMGLALALPGLTQEAQSQTRGLMAGMADVKRPDGGLTLECWLKDSQGPHRVQNSMDICVRTNKPAYLTLFDVSTERQVYTVLPCKYYRQPFLLEADRIHTIPGDVQFDWNEDGATTRKQLTLTITGPPGWETVFAVATTAPLNLLRQDLVEWPDDQVFASVGPDRSEALFRHVKECLEQSLPDTDWAASMVEFLIVEDTTPERLKPADDGAAGPYYVSAVRDKRNPDRVWSVVRCSAGPEPHKHKNVAFFCTSAGGMTPDERAHEVVNRLNKLHGQGVLDKPENILVDAVQGGHCVIVRNPANVEGLGTAALLMTVDAAFAAAMGEGRSTMDVAVRLRNLLRDLSSEGAVRSVDDGPWAWLEVPPGYAQMSP